MMTELKEWLDSIPSTTWTIALLIVLGSAFVLFVKFNRYILAWVAGVRAKIFAVFSKNYGGALRNANKTFRRTAFLNQDGLGYKIYRFFDDIIVDLNLTQNGVTVFGLLLFIAFVSLLLAIMAMIVLQLDIPLMLSAWFACFALVLVLFRFSALSKKEKRENAIMDAVDLLVSDVKGGVYNAITTYMDSFHPDIRIYFLEFVDNMTTKGLSFKSSMLVLNEKLGHTFSDFAHKAILYEEKADDEFDDIFSAILETNRHLRYLRVSNNMAFKNIMNTLTVSFMAIMAFAVYIIMTEPMVQTFLLYNAVGKFMILADVAIFVIVMGYLTGLRAKSFN